MQDAMFNKKANTTTPSTKTANSKNKPRETIPTIVTPDVHLLGNIVSEGTVDFSGTIDGNIRCDVLTLREKGVVKGEITANTVHIQGTVKGLIRAKNVHLLASCKMEGIIIHEQLSIEDGAFVDGKFKRSDRITETTGDESESETNDDNAENIGPVIARSGSNTKMLENIRLIR
jgi:cytoskeletal protein CcmA (bactofilin family)